MRIAILGAAGRTGRRILEQAEQAGHETVAVVRRPHALGDRQVRVAEGSDAAAVTPAIAGCDAVVFAIGPTAQTTDAHLMRNSIAATLTAMSAAGVRRLVVVGADGPWRGSGDPLTRFVAKPILNRVLREGMRDFVETERLVRASDTDWTIIRPAQLTDRPSTRYRRRREKSNWFGFQTTRAATAAAVIDALADPSTGGAAYAVS